MVSLQIRDLPEHLYEILVERARKHRRSLAQQATVELEELLAARARSRRLEAVARLRARVASSQGRSGAIDPVEAVREDRER